MKKAKKKIYRNKKQKRDLIYMGNMRTLFSQTKLFSEKRSSFGTRTNAHVSFKQNENKIIEFKV